MRPHEFLAVALLCAAAVAQADPSDYGKVDTFQPGKKYNCVPTADHKGWDCKVTGDADAPPAPARAQTPVAAPVPAPAQDTFPAEAPAQPAPHASALPGYLTNSSGANQPMQSMPAAPAPKPPPQPRVKGPMVPAQAPAMPVVKPQAAPARVQVKPTPQPASPAAAATPSAQAGHDFLALSAAQYVIELAHADSAASLDAARATTHPAHGEVYELHLSQNGNDMWLLLWGPFANLEAARAARAELAAQGATPGWPRRVGPLQAEVRRNGNE